jgi:hypothetical protein
VLVGVTGFGINAFQTDRSPIHMYRARLHSQVIWTHPRGGFYHDGRFASLQNVIEHYDTFLQPGLTEQEKHNRIEYLKSLC